MMVDEAWEVCAAIKATEIAVRQSVLDIWSLGILLLLYLLTAAEL
jgi:hypothetical protein